MLFRAAIELIWTCRESIVRRSVTSLNGADILPKKTPSHILANARRIVIHQVCHSFPILSSWQVLQFKVPSTKLCSEILSQALAGFGRPLFLGLELLAPGSERLFPPCVPVPLVCRFGTASCEPSHKQSGELIVVVQLLESPFQLRLLAGFCVNNFFKTSCVYTYRTTI